MSANDGDSFQVDMNLQASEAFGFGPDQAGETTMTTNTQTEETDVPATQDDPKAADATAEDPSTDAEVATVDKAEKARLEEAHKLLIDTIQDKFTARDNGELTDDELAAWFQENPALANVANRAKRVKDAYRTLMETPRAPRAEPESVEPTEEEQPLTAKALQDILEKRDEALLLKQYERANRVTFDTYVKDYDIKGDSADKLKSIAGALYTANNDWSYEESLQAAHRALFAGKRSPVGVPATAATPPEPSAQQDKIDLSERTPALSFADFTS